MPCGDITERIRLTIDADKRIDAYRFFKKTCGGEIGSESMLIDQIGGLSIENVLSDFDIPQETSSIDENNIEMYLRQKHLFAIKSVLNVYIGNNSGGVKDFCSIAGIEFDNGSTIIDADVKLVLPADEVEPCAHCGPN